MTVSMLRSTHPAYPGWLWYWWGEQKQITGYGPANLVRNTVQNTGPVCFLPLDVILAGSGDMEPDSQTKRDEDTGKYKFTRIWPDKYFGSLPIEPPPVIVVDPLPDDEPVEPPPIIIIEPPEDEPPMTTTIKMTLQRGKGLPLIVGNWFEAGKPVKLSYPDGRLLTTTTGAKGGEFGPNSFEAGYAVSPGDYILTVDGNVFTVPMPSGEFTRCSFERVSDGETEEMVKLVSRSMDKSKADGLLILLDGKDDTRGIFSIV